jgi:hypothetical protein
VAPTTAGAAHLFTQSSTRSTRARSLATGTPRSGVGYVTRFGVRRDFVERYEIQQVGGRTILEYWIPAEDLEVFNDNIVGVIEVIAEYRPESL